MHYYNTVAWPKRLRTLGVNVNYLMIAGLCSFAGSGGVCGHSESAGEAGCGVPNSPHPQQCSQGQVLESQIHGSGQVLRGKAPSLTSPAGVLISAHHAFPAATSTGGAAHQDNPCARICQPLEGP